MAADDVATLPRDLGGLGLAFAREQLGIVQHMADIRRAGSPAMSNAIAGSEGPWARTIGLSA